MNRSAVKTYGCSMFTSAGRAGSRMICGRANDLRNVADAVLGSMRLHEIPATPDNYALWYEYHAGSNVNLCRTIDAIISNRLGFDEKTLNDLHASFFDLAREKRAVRDTSKRVVGMLQEIVSLVSCVQEDTKEFGSAICNLASAATFERTIEELRKLIEDLVSESQRMAGRSEYVVVRMQESAEKIKTLEQSLEDALREAALDALTGLANRRSFDMSMRRLAGDAMNSGDELSLLMIDIDHFKSVNDTWGHQVGDLVLRYMGICLKQCVHGDDVVARYGGEEFAILLPRTDCSSAAIVGENIRQFLLREPCRIEAVAGMAPVTVSIGAANYYPGEALSDWIARADQALYTAKQEGRDCVRSASCVNSQFA
ncbi:diguanylate cyclase [Acidobacteria bacterium AB60]|nr:diguanylate cyclase [Acidobacteria bacterium AB60]